MGKMEAIADEGKIKYFWNTKDHNPPHFHAQHREGDWEIRVFFLDCNEGYLKYDYKFPPEYTPEKHPLPTAYRKEILEKVLRIHQETVGGKGETIQHSFQDVLYKEWDRKVKIDENLKQ